MFKCSFDKLSLFFIKREGRVNQSCLTADIWFHSECVITIPHISKMSTHCGRREGGTIVVPRVVPGWYHGGIEGGTWYRFILDI